MTRIGSDVRIYPALEVQRWEIVQKGEMLGILRLLRVRQPDQDEEFYQVQRVDGQICGEIDRKGRGWRHQPFQKEMAFLGMDSMEKNVIKLLEVDGKIEIREWNEKAAVEASMKWDARQQARESMPIQKPVPRKSIQTRQGAAFKGSGSKDSASKDRR